jgi:hypothetical protein
MPKVFLSPKQNLQDFTIAANLLHENDDEVLKKNP